MPGISRYDLKCAGKSPVRFKVYREIPGTLLQCMCSCWEVRASISNLEIQVRVSISNLEIQVRVSIRKSPPFTCEGKQAHRYSRNSVCNSVLGGKRLEL